MTDSPSRTAPSGPSAGPALRFAYGTNGLADLRLTDALELLADLGYDGVSLTLDHMHLDPCATDLLHRAERVAVRLRQLGLACVIETGARFVLDPVRKHWPTLLEPEPGDRSRRVALLLNAVRVASVLGARAVHCFSGVVPAGTSGTEAWRRLTDSLARVVDAAHRAGVSLAVEPEPGMLLDTLDAFGRLRTALGDPPGLGLTLDLGHCRCLEPRPVAECVRDAAPWLSHVQIEDMRRGVHEHLPLGDGEIDFPPVLTALADIGYRGLVSVELPRHSHAGPELARRSLRFLRQARAIAGEEVTSC